MGYISPIPTPTFLNNTALANDGDAFYLYLSNYNIIANNTASESVSSNKCHGVYLSFSDYNTLTKNVASDNWHGIWFYHSNGNILTNNTASNSKSGIYLYFSENNIIANNTVHHNE